MDITVLLFGITRELINSNSININIKAGSSVNDFKTELEKKFPQLKNLNSYAIAINENYVANEHMIIQDKDIVAIIPPVSGG